MYKFELDILVNPISLRLIFLIIENDDLTKVNSLSESILIIQSSLKNLSELKYMELKFHNNVN